MLVFQNKEMAAMMVYQTNPLESELYAMDLSYLSTRQQFVQVNDKQSCLKDVLFGVPQGSLCLGAGDI